MSAKEKPPTSGMLPQWPMTRCSKCGNWSYLAAIDGCCLRCDMTDREVPDDH